MIFDINVSAEFIKCTFFLRAIGVLTRLVLFRGFNINSIFSEFDIVSFRRHHFLSKFVDIFRQLLRSLYNLNLLPM